MVAHFKRIVIICLSMLLLTSCSLENLMFDDTGDTGNSEEIEKVEEIGQLHETDNFRKGALEHILEGELNARGKAVGFHYDDMPTKKGEIIPGTESKPNKQGVYEAKVKVSGVSKTSNGGKSTFFPKELTAQEVIDAINEAYSTSSYISGNTYEGLTSDGIRVRMYLDQNNKIISAFPVY